MKPTLKNEKTSITIIALVLTLTISALMVSLPIAGAADVYPTNAYIVVSPNPVGVNQQITIYMWLVQLEPTSNRGAGGRWENLTVLITKPDGTTQTLGPFRTDDAAAAYSTYTPDQIGDYTIKLIFPGKQVTGTSAYGFPIDAYYEPSSYTVMLTVQEENVEATPQTPLPTEYWTRPINAENFDWSTISGNWLGTCNAGRNGAYNGTGNFNAYTTAPNSGHIMWTKPLMTGGLIGGEFGGTPMAHYYSGKTYEPGFRPVAIINGVLYYNYPYFNPGDQGLYAVDLRTGETLWHQENITSITCGQLYNYISPNQEGAIPYLWTISGSTWYMYDAYTGNFILQIENATLGSTSWQGGGNIVEGPNGELLVYVLDPANDQLSMWNSSLCLLSQTTDLWKWRPQVGATFDWKDGVQWTATIDAYPDETIHEINSGVILATTSNLLQFPQNWQMEKGYNMTTGEELWVQNRTTPQGLIAWGLMGSVGEGVYTEFDKGEMVWYGYSVYSGEQIWGPTETCESAWASLPTNDKSVQVAYGISYHSHIDGIHAINITTGERLWDFYGDPAGLDFPGYSTLPFETNMLNTIADGKYFAPTGDSHGVPQFRGAELYAIDAYSGDEVWSISGYYQCMMPVADGYLVGYNAYDNQLYTFGKGPSATTVTAPDVGVPLGSSLVIKGTVTDECAGAKQLVEEGKFSSVPAISDDCMSEWMEYVYMQEPIPKDAEGVEVILTTLDPNGNTYELGRTTSSDRGTFGCEIELPVPGMYKIIATFEGSESYYGSSAETYVIVEEATSAAQPIEPEAPVEEPEAPTAPEEPAEEPAAPEEPTSPEEPTEPEPTEPEPTEPAEAPLITTELAIIAAVAIAIVVGIAAYWKLRKRK